MTARIPQIWFSYKERQFIDRTMDQVSRSFAVMTLCLEEPFDRVLSIAYLLCRVADNIEDCEASTAWQEARFDELRSVLDAPESANARLEAWPRQQWSGLTSAEQEMMISGASYPLWRLYAALPSKIRSLLSQWVGTMISGMASAESKLGAPLQHDLGQTHMWIVHDVSTYNEYCYYVAGTVGHLLTELALFFHAFDSETSAALWTRAEACGRGLQKTNILKDFADDHARGMCYLPASWMRDVNHSPLALDGAPLWWSRQVIEDILSELDQLSEYIEQVPREAAGFRLALLICLLPAFKTLHMAAEHSNRLFTRDHKIKIPRETFRQCLHEARGLVADDTLLASHLFSQRQSIIDALEIARVWQE